MLYLFSDLMKFTVVNESLSNNNLIAIEDSNYKKPQDIHFKVHK